MHHHCLLWKIAMHASAVPVVYEIDESGVVLAEDSANSACAPTGQSRIWGFYFINKKIV